MNRQMVVALVALLMAACARDPKDGPGAAPADSTASRPDVGVKGQSEALDACDLVSTADLAAVFAPRTFATENGGPEPRNRAGSATQNSVTSCTFVSRGTSIRDMVTVSVMVVTSPSDAAQRSTEQMKQGATSLGLNATPIDLPGLGDAAYWVNLGSASRSAVAINVKQGSRRWLTVSESSSGQSVDDTVARLTTIAKSALGKL
jgi:hypothetical protein